MYQYNKHKCLDHNKLAEGINTDQGLQLDKIYCMLCESISKSTNFQQYNEDKIKQYINIQRHRYKQLKQFKVENYWKKQQFRNQINQPIINQIIQKPLPIEKNQEVWIKSTIPQNDISQEQSQKILLQLESQILRQIEPYFYNQQIYHSYISYRTNWMLKGQISTNIFLLKQPLFYIFSLHKPNNKLLKDGFYVIFNNAMIMDGYFIDGRLVEGIIITDDWGKIEVNKNVKEFKYYQMIGFAYKIPFKQEILQKYLEYHFHIIQQFQQEQYE